MGRLIFNVSKFTEKYIVWRSMPRNNRNLSVKLYIPTICDRLFELIC